MKKNIVFGASGLIGLAFHNLVKKNKNFIFFSKSDNRFQKINLNSKLKKFPFDNVNNCYFFASPRILKKNFDNKSFKNELNWLKKIISKIKINKLIYISSSSVYYKKNHIIGSIKLKCEKYIKKKNFLFSSYQIWRPFNLIGDKYAYSDHFHNYLFKQMFIKNKKKSFFSGNASDMRGYADVNHFVKTMYKQSKNSKSFIRDYGNNDLVKISDIIKLFNKHYKKINGNNFEPIFKSKAISINQVSHKKNTILYNKKSLNILKNYLTKSIYEKKM